MVSISETLNFGGGYNPRFLFCDMRVLQLVLSTEVCFDGAYFNQGKNV